MICAREVWHFLPATLAGHLGEVLRAYGPAGSVSTLRLARLARRVRLGALYLRTVSMLRTSRAVLRGLLQAPLVSGLPLYVGI